MAFQATKVNKVTLAFRVCLVLKVHKASKAPPVRMVLTGYPELWVFLATKASKVTLAFQGSQGLKVHKEFRAATA